MVKLINILVYFLKFLRVNEIIFGILFGSWVLIVFFFEFLNCDGVGYGDKSRWWEWEVGRRIEVVL